MMSIQSASSRRNLAFSWILLACCHAAWVAPATAQVERVLPGQRPSDQRLPQPLLDERTVPTLEPILPPVRIPEGDAAANASDMAIEVRKIEIKGNTVVPIEVLQAIAQPYEGRALTHSDLQTLRDRLTLAYVERGYATSGAELPEQTIVNGLLEVRVVEGKLGDIEVEVAGRLRPGYFRSRLARSQQGVLHVPSLQKQLQLFQLDPQIETIQARLEPTVDKGRARLELSVREAPFYNLAADFDTYRSPAIGSFGGTAHADLRNLIGVGDALYARFTGSEGLRQVEAGFDVPFTVWDTRLGARYQHSKGEVVDSAFESLEIESESTSVELTLSQPLYRDLHSYLGVDLVLDWRRAQSFLFGGDIGLPTLYDDEGKSQGFVVRLGVDASYSTRSQSLQFRSLLSYGVNALGATINSGDVADGRFVAWLGQLQWASRLPWRGAQVLSRFDVQLSPDPLLPLEQYSVGGRYTVRGYRENSLVRDQGLNASVELRVPVFEQQQPAILVELAPFADVGRSWNNTRAGTLAESEPMTLVSAGLGLRMRFLERIFGEFYWGHRFVDLEAAGDRDLQDDGIHLRLGLTWP